MKQGHWRGGKKCGNLDFMWWWSINFHLVLRALLKGTPVVIMRVKQALPPDQIHLAGPGIWTLRSQARFSNRHCSDSISVFYGLADSEGIMGTCLSQFVAACKMYMSDQELVAQNNWRGIVLILLEAVSAIQRPLDLVFLFRECVNIRMTFWGQFSFACVCWWLTLNHLISSVSSRSASRGRQQRSAVS